MSKGIIMGTQQTILILFNTYSLKVQQLFENKLAPARVVFASSVSEARQIVQKHSVSHAIVPFNSSMVLVSELGELVVQWHNSTIDERTNPISLHLEGHQHVSSEGHIRHEVRHTVAFVRKVLDSF
jgi:hypothetical protein